MEHQLRLDYLKSILHYNPDTGTWTRFFKKHKCENVGALDSNGHRQIWVAGRLYMSAPLAWFYMKGKWPPREIDHKDRNPSNDAWANLRLATRGQNCANRKAHSNNKLGIKGICYDDKRKKYVVRVFKDKKTRFFGRYDDLNEAINVNIKWRSQIHGQFSGL